MKNLLFLLLALLIPAISTAQQKRGVVQSETKPLIENRGELSPARPLEGRWEGTMTACENNRNQVNPQTNKMTLDIKQNGNIITGTMTFGNSRGTFEGLINGAYIDFTCQIGNGCIKVHGSLLHAAMY